MAIWTVCETRGNDFSPTTYELLSQARKVGAEAGIETVAVAVGGEAELADKLNGQAHQVIYLKWSNSENIDAGSWVEALCGICASVWPVMPRQPPRPAKGWLDGWPHCSALARLARFIASVFKMLNC